VNGGANQWSTCADGCHPCECYCTSAERPRTCVFTSGVDARPILTFCSINFVAVLVKYEVYGENITVIVCSTYLLYDSVDPSPSKEMAEVANCCWERYFTLILGCDANFQNVMWGILSSSSRVRALLESCILPQVSKLFTFLFNHSSNQRVC
jgi:hypothetical protein